MSDTENVATIATEETIPTTAEDTAVEGEEATEEAAVEEAAA